MKQRTKFLLLLIVFLLMKWVRSKPLSIYKKPINGDVNPNHIITLTTRIFQNGSRMKRAVDEMKIYNLTNSMERWIDKLPKSRQKEVSWKLAIFINNEKNQNERIVKRLNSERQLAVRNLNAQHEVAIQNLNAQHEVAIQNLNAQHEVAIQNLNCKHEMAVRDLKNEINNLKKDLYDAKADEIASIPISLIDTFEAEYSKPYVDFIYNTTNTIANIKSHLLQVQEDRKYIEEQMENLDLTKKARSKLAAQRLKLLALEDTKTGLSAQIKNLEIQLPQLQNEVTRRAHKWYWLLTNEPEWNLRYRLPNDDIKKILAWIKKDYNSKTADYKKSTTLKGFIEKFCKAVALARESAFIDAEYKKKIPVEKGYKLASFHVYGNEIDKFLTILINALGLRYLESPTKISYEVEKMPADDPHYTC